VFLELRLTIRALQMLRRGLVLDLSIAMGTQFPTLICTHTMSNAPPKPPFVKPTKISEDLWPLCLLGKAAAGESRAR
jgi:hypothetical protein